MNLDDQALSRLIRRHATRHPAPDALGARIRTQIALETAALPPNPSSSGLVRWWRPADWRSAAAGAAVGVALTVGVGTVVVPRIDAYRATPSIEGELVGDHVRSMGVGPLIEVASSDRHTVKPWLQGQLDYAPPVPDLSADGFALLGARVEHIAGTAVAAFVYTRNQHILNVYVRPADSAEKPLTAVRRGFNLQRFTVAAMQVWVVSDVEAGEVERFSVAWQKWVAGSGSAGR